MQYVYVIIDYDTDFDFSNNIIGIHKTRESARKEVNKYLGDVERIEIKEHHEYGMFDEYFYTVTEVDGEVRKCFLLIKAMEVEEWV